MRYSLYLYYPVKAFRLLLIIRFSSDVPQILTKRSFHVLTRRSSVFLMCSLDIHQVFLMCSLGIHQVFLMCSLGIHQVFLMCSLGIHQVLLICSLGAVVVVVNPLLPAYWGVSLSVALWGFAASFSRQSSSRAATPEGSLHKSRADSVVCICGQLKRWCVVCS